jgi:hypothetical protein
MRLVSDGGHPNSGLTAGSIAHAQTDRACSRRGTCSAAIPASAVLTWFTTTLVQMSAWIGHWYVTLFQVTQPRRLSCQIPPD